MFDPATFLTAILAIVGGALVMALALLVTLRLFSVETLEFQPLFFITLMGHLLAGGLGYIILGILARQAVPALTLGSYQVPSAFIALVWLVVLMALFFVLMVKIVGKVALVKSLGAVLLAVLLVAGLAFLGGIVVMIVMGASVDELAAQLNAFFAGLPRRLADGVGIPTPTGPPAR